MVPDWTNFLPAGGSAITPPSIPDGTLETDQSVETGGQLSQTLSGTITGVINVGDRSTGGAIVLDGDQREIVIYNGIVPVMTFNAGSPANGNKQQFTMNDGTFNRVLIGAF